MVLKRFRLFLLLCSYSACTFPGFLCRKTNKGLKDKSAQGFLAEPDNSIDVVFVETVWHTVLLFRLKYLMPLWYIIVCMLCTVSDARLFRRLCKKSL